MGKFQDRIGGFNRYLRVGLIVILGVAIIYWPGRLGSDAQNQFFVVLGASMAGLALGWTFLTLDRQVSGNPRYQRPGYPDEEDDG